MQIKELFHFLAMIRKRPIFSVMIGIDDGENYALHVTVVRSCEIGGIEEVESNGFTVGRSAGSHAGLVSGAAIMREDQPVGPIEMEHRNHVLRAVAVDFAH